MLHLSARLSPSLRGGNRGCVCSVADKKGIVRLVFFRNGTTPGSGSELVAYSSCSEFSTDLRGMKQRLTFCLYGFCFHGEAFLIHCSDIIYIFAAQIIY
jgi:hypothetical protein